MSKLTTSDWGIGLTAPSEGLPQPNRTPLPESSFRPATLLESWIWRQVALTQIDNAADMLLRHKEAIARMCDYLQKHPAVTILADREAIVRAMLEAAKGLPPDNDPGFPETE
jgi:hypothetical protein